MLGCSKKQSVETVRIYGFKLGGVNCLKRVFATFSALNEITSRKP